MGKIIILLGRPVGGDFTWARLIPPTTYSLPNVCPRRAPAGRRYVVLTWHRRRPAIREGRVHGAEAKPPSSAGAGPMRDLPRVREFGRAAGWFRTRSDPT